MAMGVIGFPSFLVLLGNILELKISGSGVLPNLRTSIEPLNGMIIKKCPELLYETAVVKRLDFLFKSEFAGVL